MYSERPFLTFSKLNTLFLAAFSLPFSAISNGAEKEIWKIASLEWQPHSGSKFPQQGNSIEKLRQLLAKDNIELQVDFFPWKRAKKIVKSNSEYIGVYPAWPLEVSPPVLISPTIDCSSIAVFTHIDSDVRYTSIETLFQDYSVGLVNTYVYPEIIEQVKTKYPHNVSAAISSRLLVKMLSAKRNSAAIADPEVASFHIKKEGITNLRLVEYVTREPLVIAFTHSIKNESRLLRLKKILEKEQPIDCRLTNKNKSNTLGSLVNTGFRSELQKIIKRLFSQ